MFAASAPLAFAPHSLVDPRRIAAKDSNEDRTQDDDSPPRDILVCIDGSEFGSRVVEHAQRVARAFGARLTLLRVLESEVSAGEPPADPFEWEVRQREARAHLDALTAQAGATKRAMGTELIQGLAPEQICRWAERHDIGLTVLCSHGTRGLTEWDLASTARKLIDRIPGSLLLVPAAVMRGESTYSQILVPLDGSARAESVLPSARRIAASQDAEIVLAHVLRVPELMHAGVPGAEGADLERRFVAHNRRLAHAYLDRLRARIRAEGARARTCVIDDASIRHGLARAIEREKIDLVVMSSYGRGGRRDLAFGSIAEYAVRHAATPILVVRDGPDGRMRRVGAPGARLGERRPSAPPVH